MLTFTFAYENGSQTWRRRGYVFFSHKVAIFCCSPVKKMKIKVAWIMQNSKFIKVFIHDYTFETY